MQKIPWKVYIAVGVNYFAWLVTNNRIEAAAIASTLFLMLIYIELVAGKQNNKKDD